MQRILRSFPRAISISTPKKSLFPIRPLSTTTATMTASNGTAAAPVTTPLNADTFLSLIKNRRSFYPLSKTLPITTARIQEIITEAVQHVPSSFNSQSNRAVVLLNGEHDKFWDITTEILKGIVPAEAWEPTGAKMAMFKGAAGTVLFFEDEEVVKGLQDKFALYADR